MNVVLVVMCCVARRGVVLVWCRLESGVRWREVA